MRIEDQILYNILKGLPLLNCIMKYFLLKRNSVFDNINSYVNITLHLNSDVKLLHFVYYELAHCSDNSRGTCNINATFMQ